MRVVKRGKFFQTCPTCDSDLEFEYEDTYETRDYLGDLNFGRYAQCPICQKGFKVDGL